MPNRGIPQDTQGSGTSFTVPAPTKGLNTRDDKIILAPDEARVLQNFFPDHGDCQVRPGYQIHCTSNNTFESAFVYSSATGRTLLAGGNNKVFDVSGSTPTQISTTTITNNFWSTENFAGKLIGVNGVDAPWIWDGTTFAATTFSGTTLTSLNTISLVRTRLWFTVNNSGDVWYGGISSIGGKLNQFPLSQIASGGKCVDINSWSVTGGEGTSDAVVFVMNTGEIIVYTGDPAADSFQLVGKFMAPPPIISSFGCTLKIGGQLIIWTQAGMIPIASIVQGQSFDPTALGPWGKIVPSIAQDFLNFGSNDGWSSTYHNGVAYFNIITGNATTKQYVFNTRAQAWTTYDGLPAGQFASIGTSLYFSEYEGGHMFLHQGGTDNGAPITATARQGFSYPLDPGKSKQFTMVKPNISADGSIQGQFQVDTDFIDSPIDSTIHTLSSSAGTTPWDSPWDSPWSADATVLRKWRSLSAYGVAVSPVTRIYSSADTAKWASSEIMAIPGGIF